MPNTTAAAINAVKESARLMLLSITAVFLLSGPVAGHCGNAGFRIDIPGFGSGGDPQAPVFDEDAAVHRDPDPVRLEAARCVGVHDAELQENEGNASGNRMLRDARDRV